jgi:hypothetical protein
MHTKFWEETTCNTQFEESEQDRMIMLKWILRDNLWDWKVSGTISGSCPMVGFTINDAELLDSTTRQLACII